MSSFETATGEVLLQKIFLLLGLSPRHARVHTHTQTYLSFFYWSPRFIITSNSPTFRTSALLSFSEGPPLARSGGTPITWDTLLTWTRFASMSHVCKHCSASGKAGDQTGWDDHQACSRTEGENEWLERDEKLTDCEQQGGRKWMTRIGIDRGCCESL